MNRSAFFVERALWWGPGLAIVLVLLFAPLLFTDFYLSQVITKALWLGIAAASLIFLAGYVGMISLGQVALYGIAGFTMANLVAADGGSPIAWNPWLGALAGILVCTGVGLFFGAIASRSYGIYFLMITLAFGVIAFLFFGQVTQLSGPIAEPDDAAYVLERTSGVVGFFGASSMERLPTEVAMTENMKRFKAIPVGPEEGERE
jgi:branched-chain amino acid transport system permease protein